MIKNVPAKIISFFFHPLLLPTYAVILMFILPTYISHYQYEYKKIVLIIVFILSFIFPVLVIMIMLNMKAVSSMKLTKRRERTYPYALISIIYIAAYYISINFSGGIPSNVSNFILTSTIIIFVMMLLNFKIKASAHMAGIGGFISFFYVFIMKENINGLPVSFSSLNITAVHFLVLLIFLAGIIGSSRLSLNAHNLKQISIGFLTGFVIGLINIFF